MSTIAGALNVLRVDCKRLEDAKGGSKKEAMFIADVKVSKALQTYKRKLEDLEKYIEKPTSTFERNALLADLAAGIDTLGSLKTQIKVHRQVLNQPEKQYNTGLTKVLKDRKIKSRSEVSVITAEDKKDHLVISGCTVMPNGHVVLCDYRKN